MMELSDTRSRNSTISQFNNPIMDARYRMDTIVGGTPSVLLAQGVPP